MNVSYNPAISTNSKQNNIQFKGVRGEAIVRDIIKGADVKPEAIMKEIKGTFGVKTENAKDIFEAFIENIQTFFKEKNDYAKRLNEAQAKIKKFPNEKDDAVYKAENKMREFYQNIIKNKDSQISQKDKELNEIKQYVQKYEPMTKVKSVEEVGVILPERAKEILNEIIENRVKAYKSMEDFLFTGKGQEAALKQLDRMMEISKAQKDGIFNIPELETMLKNIQHNHRVYISSSTLYNMENMITSALSGSKKVQYLESNAMKEQIKKNAMAILTPHANERFFNESVKSVADSLDKEFKEIIQNYRGFAKGIEKLKKRHNNNVELEFKEVPYNNVASKVIVKPASEAPYELEYYRVSSFGNSNWS